MPAKELPLGTSYPFRSRIEYDIPQILARRTYALITNQALTPESPRSVCEACRCDPSSGGSFLRISQNLCNLRPKLGIMNIAYLLGRRGLYRYFLNFCSRLRWYLWKSSVSCSLVSLSDSNARPRRFGPNRRANSP
jgi:hypothetical protein